MCVRLKIPPLVARISRVIDTKGFGKHTKILKKKITPLVSNELLLFSTYMSELLVLRYDHVYARHKYN